VSRRHARITRQDGHVFVEDLGSRNGVILNSRPVTTKVIVRVGDTIAIGDEVLEIVAAPETAQYRLRNAPTLTGVPLDGLDDPVTASEHTRRASAFVLLAGVVDKALALGQGEEAERMLQLHLTRLLDQAAVGRTVSLETAETAARYAVKLANATGKAFWIDYAVRLFTAIRKPLPIPVVDELYGVLRKLSGVSRSLLREYVAALRAQASQLSASERFALQRIEGLERIAAL
jgi:hypothetical protein